MSPAPVRERRPRAASFPHAWGYWLGLFLMVAGVAAAVFFVVTAIQGFRDDVNGLRRAVDVDNLEVNLERGEYLVFDEDGIDVGPFGVRVFRTSDGLEVPTSDIVDGTTYDVDGLEGRARVGFNVPTSDIYRVELDTSLGDAARFAVGGDVGNDRANRIIQGLVLGAVLFILGFVAIIWTLALHARWRLRAEVTERASTAREVLATATEPMDSADTRRDTATEASERATTWARERIERARAAIPSSDVPTIEGEHGRPPTLRQTVTDRVNQALDAADRQLDAAEPVIGEAAAGAEAPTDIAARIDEALGRVQDRVAKGDRLRDIAADERVAAEATAAELAAQARTAQENVVEQASSLEEQILERAGAEIEALSDEPLAIGTEAVDALTADAELAGEDLIAGAAGAASGALAAGAERARTTARKRLSIDLPEPPPSLETWLDQQQGDELDASPPMPPAPPPSLDDWRAERQTGEDSPPATSANEGPDVQPSDPEPATTSSRGEPATAPESRHMSILAPPPAAVRTLAAKAPSSHASRGATDTTPRSEAGTAPAPAFSALAPPPTAARTLMAGPAAAPSGSEHGADDAVLADGETGDAASAETHDEAARAAESPSNETGPRSFTLAPPPDYS